MKIYNINNLNFDYKSPQKISFNGNFKKNDNCLFIYDLDGTLANGTNEQIRKVLEISKSKNAKIIYATGRGIEDFYTLQYELLSKNCKLNLPDFLIANNGEKIYTKYNNQLIKNYEYSQFIKENTNFDKAYITKKISSINNSLEELESSPMTIKYNVPANINIRELRKNILEYLLKDKINILCGYKGESTNNQTLFIAPFNKAMAINFLKKKMNISYDKILMAGNDNNDISMAKLSKQGAKFICLNNSKPNLIKACKELSLDNKNIFFSIESGAKGIIEGLLKFLN